MRNLTAPIIPAPDDVALDLRELMADSSPKCISIHTNSALAIGHTLPAATYGAFMKLLMVVGIENDPISVPADREILYPLVKPRNQEERENIEDALAWGWMRVGDRFLLNATTREVFRIGETPDSMMETN